MNLSADALADMIQANLKKHGDGGANQKKFCQALATGIVMTIVGKPFITQDVGTVAGPGVGNGTGIKTLMYDDMTQLALAMMPTKGENARKCFDAINMAVVDHLKSSATLKSTHAPVAIGVGTIMHIASILAPEMAKNIDDQLKVKGANGSNRTIFSLCVATGICTDILKNSTGQVIIVGSPIGIPAPGAGVGAGVIS
jgi:hypothetical protein